VLTETQSNKHKQVYTTAISKGAGCVEETRKLLQHWEPGTDMETFLKRVQDEDLVGASTAYRTKDVVTRVFRPRFLTPTDRPARILKMILQKGLKRQTFTEMLFVFACRSDPLIHDFTVREYWPAARRGKNVLTTQDGVDFLTEARYDGRLENEWSSSVSTRISRCVLGMLRDVGLLRGDGSRKEIAPYSVTDETVAILARDLHESGTTDSSLHDNPDWGLFGLQGQRPLEILERMGRSSGLIMQRAGSVVRITWQVQSMEELIDVLAG
jgi:hypothetical protein